MNTRTVLATMVVFAATAASGAACEVRLRGPEGARLDACIKRNVAKTDPLYLAECFFRRNESHLWQSEFWGKYMHSAVPYWRYTKDAALKAKIDAGRELPARPMRNRRPVASLPMRKTCEMPLNTARTRASVPGRIAIISVG